MFYLKKTKICRKCNSANILGPKRVRDDHYIMIQLKRKTATLESYVCVDCGYTEFYSDKKGMQNIRDAYESDDKDSLW